MNKLTRTVITLTAIGVAVKVNRKIKVLSKEINTTNSTIKQLIDGSIKTN